MVPSKVIVIPNRMGKQTQTPFRRESRSFSEKNAILVAGSRFELGIKPVLREIILDLLQVKGPLSIRQICLEFNESNDHRVRMILKRLWKKRSRARFLWKLSKHQRTSELFLHSVRSKTTYKWSSRTDRKMRN